jgi:hypothetical protein
MGQEGLVTHLLERGERLGAVLAAGHDTVVEDEDALGAAGLGEHLDVPMVGGGEGERGMKGQEGQKKGLHIIWGKGEKKEFNIFSFMSVSYTSM